MRTVSRLQRRPFPPILIAAFLAALAVGCGNDSQDRPRPATRSLVLVAPHPDDETILAGATLFRAARDGRTTIQAIYLTSGDASGLPGSCFEPSEEEKKRKIVELREEETRAVWDVLGVDPSRLHFLRYPDTRLVESSELSGGRRVDVLSEAGEQAVAEISQLLPDLVPEEAEELVVITSSFWDAHGDHRTAYRAARAGAEAVRNERGIPVTLLHSIVHDEMPFEVPFCCMGDLFWPRPGAQDDYGALTDSAARPRPPFWDRVDDVSELVTVRTQALLQHDSQINGRPDLCILFPMKRFMENWTEKAQEVFHEEEL